ncbi:MAG: hypothetical protein GY719_05375 [bacterium]|nr:hypothetical protein [bacterium]
MIAFASLFLGLLVGPEPVELLVGSEVARVEIRLDGETVSTLQGAPWTTVCDFGPELVPHEMVAVGYDQNGQEVARARQWVNLPRRPAEASMLLEGGEKGRGVIAHLSWESVVADAPAAIGVTFDGRRVPVEDPRRIVLPDHDPEKLHLLRAELDFSRNVTTVLELVFGGSYADRLDVELTAVPVVLERGARLPPVAELRGGLLEGGHPLEVVAAEEGPAEVVIVRDEEVRQVLNRLGRTSEKALRKQARLGLEGVAAKSLRYKMPLPKGHQVRFLWPFPERQETARLDFETLSPSQTFTSRDGGLYWLLTEFSPPATVMSEQRLADAVAVAGLLAAGRNRRRAVVLVIGAGTTDASRFTPEQARRYLRQLRVPLFVWSPLGNAEAPTGWGPVTDISTLRKLGQAVRDLERRLERQRIVWVAGVHPPADIELAPHVAGMHLAP